MCVRKGYALQKNKCTAMGAVMKKLAIAGAVLGLTSTQAVAQDNIISEARIGALYHNFEDYGETGLDINAEVLFQPLPGNYDNAFLNFILTPRPHVGADINVDGNTSFVYAGFSWTAQVLGPIFIEGAFGGAWNNGKHGTTKWPDRAEMGCALSFHEALSIGVTLQQEWRVMGTVEHFSNAGLCEQNAGISNVGVRIGKLF